MAYSRDISKVATLVYQEMSGIVKDSQGLSWIAKYCQKFTTNIKHC